MRRNVMEQLRRRFPPEFLNRIDETVVFRRLSEEDLREIARMLLNTLAERMQVLGISLEVTDDCVALLARKGYDGKMGARPLRRLVRTLIEDPAAVQLLQGQLRAGDTLLADGAQEVDLRVIHAAVEAS